MFPFLILLTFVGQAVATENLSQTQAENQELALSGIKPSAPALEQNLNRGKVIKLTDGTYWEINPADTPITQGWITPVEIKAKPDSSNSAYPYILTNTLTGSSVRARPAKVRTNAP